MTNETTLGAVRVVPVEPTPEMIDAFWGAFDGASDGQEVRTSLRAMLAAAPVAPADGLGSLREQARFVPGGGGLLPCPFCGEAASVDQSYRTDRYGEWVAGCDNEQCPVQPECYSSHNPWGRQAAIDGWNTRAALREAQADGRDGGRIIDGLREARDGEVAAITVRSYSMPRTQAPAADDQKRERIARAIHEGLGRGWAYSNYGGDEWNDCRAMLDAAADQVLSLIAAARAQPGEARCQACGGEVQGWMCQSCDATFTENDGGYLIIHLPDAHPADPAARGGEADETPEDRAAVVERVLADAERLANRMGATVVRDQAKIDAFIHGRPASGEAGS